MKEKFEFEITHKDPNSKARVGIIKTRKGDIRTPYFIPVATVASVKGLDSTDLKMMNTEVTLANTYHLHLRPGEDLIHKAGGIAKFMNFEKPIFTDSGGFQAFSLGLGMEHGVGKLGNIFVGEKEKQKNAKLAYITEEGVKFKSHITGLWHFIGPKESMEIQKKLGSDILMAFDECTSPLSSDKYIKEAMERTHRWAKICLENYDKENQALYGIIQGGTIEELRRESAEFITSLPFEGIAIGGNLGKTKEEMYNTLDITSEYLDQRPVHLLGIGTIEDIFEAIKRGVDTFDCVHPTRIARRGGHLYIHPKSGGTKENKYRINIRNTKHKKDFTPIDPHCNCLVCKNYTRSYIHHLQKSKEPTFIRLSAIHNTHFMLELMKEIREAIKENRFEELQKEWLNY